MTENWYLVLELEFDPKPETDEGLIEQRIEEKRKFWSGKANDFNHGPEYRKYSQGLHDIRRDMIGEKNIRAELIKDACDKTYGPVDKILKQIKKTEIPCDTIEKIAKKQKVDIEAVRRRAAALGIRIVESQGGEAQALYDSYYKTKPQNADKYSGMRQMLLSFHVENLYDFLCMGTSIRNADHLPCQALRQRAAEKKKKEFYKNDSISGTGSKLCGQCEETFQDETSKRIYDQYLEYQRRKAILDNAKEIYEVTGEISADSYHDDIGQLTELFKNRKEAEHMLAAFFKVEKIPLPAAAGDSSGRAGNIRICRCGCTNEVSDGRKVCRSCGLDLQIKCPKCGTVSDAGIKVCKCGFLFEHIDKAMALCELASNSMENMEFAAAKAQLSDAQNYWPGSERISSLQSRLAELRVRVGNAPEEMRAACMKKRYYEAGRQYEAIKRFFPDYSDPVVEEEIKAASDAAKRYKNAALASQKESDIVDAYMKAYEACCDYPGVKEMIAKYPPAEPSGLVVSADSCAKVNVLSWTKSTTKGLLYYSVVRKENAIPINVQDGTLVGRVSMCSINDQKMEPGTPYFYAVFAERAGIFSKPLSLREPVSNLFELSGVKIAAGDSALSLTWDPIAEHADVVIERIENGKNVILECNNRSSYVDNNLTNDMVYQYRIGLSYRIGAGRASTRGVMISGTPSRPLQPIGKLVVKPLSDGEFQIDWDNPENRDVRFFYSAAKPEFLSGDLLPISAIERSMDSLMVKKNTGTSGTFRYTGDHLIYIVALAEKAGTAVVGAIARASRDSQVKIMKTGMVNGKILITVGPVKDATGFVVLYRNDQFPEDLSDVKTTRKYIPFKQYEYDSGLLLDSSGQQDYYFSVFAEFQRDGEKDYSIGSDWLFSNRSKEVITYSAAVTKKLFGPGTLLLTFESEHRQFYLPDIEIMSSVGAAPMFKKSAVPFYQIPGQEVDGQCQIKIPLKKDMEKETYIRAFLKEEKLQECCQLKLKLKSDLKIS